MEQYYNALALQVRCNTVNACTDTQSARRKIEQNIDRIGEQIAASKNFIGTDTRLVVLPEYAATGFPMGESIATWRDKAAFDPDGREYDALGAIAQQSGVFLAGNAYETDPHFPDLYFQASFLIDDSGSLILRYRRLISMFAPTPHDVLDRYLEHYGAEALFPVAETPLGRIAAIASEEILYPEIARCLAVRGAEIFVHSSSEAASPLETTKHIAKRARAAENLAYVVSANSAGVADIALPEQSADAASIIVDYKGQRVAEAGSGETMAAYAPLDLNGLRAYRRRPGMPNLLARQRLDLFAETYSSRVHYPANNLLDDSGKVIEELARPHFVEQQRKVIERLSDEGII